MNKKIILLILIISVILRVYGLFNISLTPDEALNIFISQNKNITKIIFADSHAHPPLYFLMLHFWSSISTNIYYLRLLSLIFGILTVYYTIIITKKLFNSNVSVFAGIITALSPSLIYYSSITRMYSLGILLSILIIYEYIHFITTRRLNKIFLFTAILGIYTHYYFIILLAFINIHQLFLKMVNRYWILSNIIILLFTLPIVLLIVFSDKTIAVPIYTSFKLPVFYLSSIIPWDTIQVETLHIWNSHSAIINRFGYSIMALLPLALLITSIKLKKAINILLTIYLLLPVAIIFISQYFVNISGIRSFSLFSPYILIVLGYWVSKAHITTRFIILLSFLIGSLYLLNKDETLESQNNVYIAHDRKDILVFNDPGQFVVSKILFHSNNRYLIDKGALTNNILEAIEIKITDVSDIPSSKKIWYYKQNTHWPPFEKKADEIENYLAKYFNEHERRYYYDFEKILYTLE